MCFGMHLTLFPKGSPCGFEAVPARCWYKQMSVTCWILQKHNDLPQSCPVEIAIGFVWLQSHSAGGQ